ncbi:hypothetical protein PInf_019721 [Phytophthora infestans]|nr:hypothetical protein PInf_019721 [Phytophthora infestans]
MTMTDTVKALVGADARTSSEYVFDKTRIGLRVNRNYDEEMCQVLRFTTHFVATHVEKEYVMACSKVDKFNFDLKSNPGFVEVTGEAKHKVLDANVKYKEAVSAFQAICSELADISDDDEYREHLDFVVQQWRNIRQRKRVKVKKTKVPVTREETETDEVTSPVTTSRNRTGTKPEMEQLALETTPDDNEEKNTDSGLRIRLNPKTAKSDTLRRVLPLQTKYNNAGSKKPKYTRESAPVLNENALYLLPPKLLDKCVAVLPVSNTNETAIDVLTQSQTTQKDEETSTIPGQIMDSNGQNPEIECVYIAGIGTFSREQIEAMAYLANVKRSCDDELAFTKWLTQDAASAIPAAQQSTLQSMAEAIARAYPQDTIPIDGNDYHYAMLYRLKPPQWANDALILAFCARLYRTGTGVRIVGVEAASASKKKKSMSEKMKTKVQELLTEADVLLIPVNFGNMHWCAMIVDGKQNNVLYYDSMNLKTYKDVLDRMSWDLATTLSDDFKVVSVNGPIQTEGYNCGFYVMLSEILLVKGTSSSVLESAKVSKIRLTTTILDSSREITLMCAIVGEVGSVFGVKIDDGEQVWKAKEVIADKLKYTGRPDKRQLYLAKTADRAWLTQFDALEGVRDTNDCTHLQFVDAKLRSVGLASRKVGVVTEEEAAVGKGHVHVLVLAKTLNHFEKLSVHPDEFQLDSLSMIQQSDNPIVETPTLHEFWKDFGEFPPYYFVRKEEVVFWKNSLESSTTIVVGVYVSFVRRVMNFNPKS